MSDEKNELRILAETQTAFTNWRNANKKGTTIPDSLWEQSLALLSDFSLTKTARALRLNGTDLKRKAIAAGIITGEELQTKGKTTKEKPKEKSKEKPKEKPKENTFVEMLLPAEQEKSVGKTDGKTANGWRIILSRNDGTRLEIIPPEFSDTRMGTFVHGFLGG